MLRNLWAMVRNTRAMLKNSKQMNILGSNKKNTEDWLELLNGKDKWSDLPKECWTMLRNDTAIM